MLTPVDNAVAEPGAGAPGDNRHEALLRAYNLRWEREDGVGGTDADLAAALAEADTNCWPEVRRAVLYATVHKSGRDREPSYKQAIEHLLDQANADGDPAMIALGLAYRATIWFASGDRALTAASDADLAHATALLEKEEGLPVELATAHNRCAIAYGQRQLFELEQLHYEAAEKWLPLCDDTRRVAALRFNQVEANASWACALEHVGNTAAAQVRIRAGLAALQACDSIEMPPAWRWELGVVSALLTALAGDPVEIAVTELLRDISISPTYEGHVYLARALSYAKSDLHRAGAAVEKAVDLIDGSEYPTELDLALCLAADLEEQAAGKATAGRRYGKRQAELRWTARLSSLAAMEDLVSGERLRTETEFLRRQAFLDELTGLSNRRGYARYIASLQTRGLEQVALLLVDIDHFKQVNDRYGHAAGDATLYRVARILGSAIRTDDIAARLGGDEFAVVLTGAGRRVATARAKTILDAVAAEPWEEIRSGLVVRASVGVAVDHPSRFEQISSRADVELYKAKAIGGAQACVAK